MAMYIKFQSEAFKNLKKFNNARSLGIDFSDIDRGKIIFPRGGRSDEIDCKTGTLLLAEIDEFRSIKDGLFSMRPAEKGFEAGRLNIPLSVRLERMLTSPLVQLDWSGLYLDENLSDDNHPFAIKQRQLFEKCWEDYQELIRRSRSGFPHLENMHTDPTQNVIIKGSRLELKDIFGEAFLKAYHEEEEYEELYGERSDDDWW